MSKVYLIQRISHPLPFWRREKVFSLVYESRKDAQNFCNKMNRFEELLGTNTIHRVKTISVIEKVEEYTYCNRNIKG